MSETLNPKPINGFGFPGQPSVGRIVRYVLPNAEEPEPTRAEMRPAILTFLESSSADSEVWSMVVFDVTDEKGPVRDASVIVRAAYDSTRSPGTWHWPDRT